MARKKVKFQKQATGCLRRNKSEHELNNHNIPQSSHRDISLIRTFSAGSFNTLKGEELQDGKSKMKRINHDADLEKKTTQTKRAKADFSKANVTCFNNKCSGKTLDEVGKPNNISKSDICASQSTTNISDKQRMAENFEDGKRSSATTLSGQKYNERLELCEDKLRKRDGDISGKSACQLIQYFEGLNNSSKQTKSLVTSESQLRAAVCECNKEHEPLMRSSVLCVHSNIPVSRSPSLKSKFTHSEISKKRCFEIPSQSTGADVQGSIRSDIMRKTSKNCKSAICKARCNKICNCASNLPQIAKKQKKKDISDNLLKMEKLKTCLSLPKTEISKASSVKSKFIYSENSKKRCFEIPSQSTDADVQGSIRSDIMRKTSKNYKSAICKARCKKICNCVSNVPQIAKKQKKKDISDNLLKMEKLMACLSLSKTEISKASSVNGKPLHKYKHLDALNPNGVNGKVSALRKNKMKNGNSSKNSRNVEFRGDQSMEISQIQRNDLHCQNPPDLSEIYQLLLILLIATLLLAAWYFGKDLQYKEREQSFFGRFCS